VQQNDIQLNTEFYGLVTSGQSKKIRGSGICPLS